MGAPGTEEPADGALRLQLFKNIPGAFSLKPRDWEEGRQKTRGCSVNFQETAVGGGMINEEEEIEEALFRSTCRGGQKELGRYSSLENPEESCFSNMKNNRR